MRCYLISGKRYSIKLLSEVVFLYIILIHRRCKKIEREEGRSREDKRTGIVKLDIDLLKYDRRILKKEDMKRDYILEGIKGM